MAEIMLQNPWALLALPLVWLLLIAVAWRRRFKPFAPFLLRLAIVVLIVLALAQPALPTPSDAPPTTDETLVLLVDQSASLGQGGQQALRAEAARLSNEPNVQTLIFADGPLLVADPLNAAGNEQTFGGVNSEATNLAQALRLGAAMLQNQPGRLILLSDGVPTDGDTDAALAELTRRNIPVDVLIPTQIDLENWRGVQPDASLAQLSVPPALRDGETFDVVAFIQSEAAISATLQLTQNGNPLAEDVVQLEPGLNRFAFTATAADSGAQTFEATIAPNQDRLAENNRLAAVTEVYPPPQILILSQDRVQNNRLVATLTASGFETQVMQPGDLPDRLSELEPYAGMVISDVPASAFELEQMLAIQEFVRSLGRGLVVSGGPNSFSLGGYDDTPLADLLPVSLEPPPREERPPVALLLIIDHSGSMIEQQSGPATRLAMAKEAAIRATDILGPDDLLGVLMFDNRYEWVVEFQQINDGAELLETQQRIARIPPGGGTRILQALEVALPALIEQQNAVARHAVLLTDGKSFDGESGLDAYDAIVDQATEANITLSTIAIGTGADVDLLEYLAGRGRGRYHFAETPEELPALTVSESDILRSNALQEEGDYQVAIYQPHPILRGLFSSMTGEGEGRAPALDSYLAMTPKPRGEVALQVGPGDPLLSTWGYGLGRVAAWSSDLGRTWAEAWRDWPEYNRFWGQVVGYTLPAPDLGLLRLETTVAPDGTVTIVAESISNTGQPVDRATTRATLLTPDGQETSFALQQVSPGRYERELKPAATGAYQLAVTQQRSGDSPDERATAGFVVAYPAEYAAPAEGTGVTLLDQIAQRTGGQRFGLGEIERVTAPPIDPDAAPQTELIELWPWLLIAALALWPLEIALRRWGRLRIQ